MRKIICIILSAIVFAVTLSGPSYAGNKYSTDRKKAPSVKDLNSKDESKEEATQFQSVDFEIVLSRNKNPIIEDHLLFFQGLKYLNTKNFNEAEKSFNDVIITYPESVWSNLSRLKLADSLFGAKRYAEAMKHVDIFLKTGPNRFELFEASLLKGKILIGMGSPEAVSYIKGLVQKSSEDAELSQVAALFDDMDKSFSVNMREWFNRPEIQYRIAESFDEFSQWDEAIKRLKNNVISHDVSPDLKKRAEFLLAKCLARIHKYSEAMEIFKDLRQNSEFNFQGLLFWMSRTYAKMDMYEEAIAIRKSLVERYGRSASSADFKSKIAFLYVDQGKYREAISEWLDVISMGPKGENLMTAKWYLAWSYYRLNELDKALEIFDWMISNGAKRHQMGDQVEYWKARALIESGKKAEGNAILGMLASKSNYYGEISRRRLNGDSRTYKDFALIKSGFIGKKSAQTGLASVEGLKRGNIHLSRAVALNEIGLNTLAAREVRAAEKSASGVDPFAMMELARLASAHDVGYRIAVQRFGSALTSFPRGGGESLYIWEQAYPEAYRNLTRKFAAGSEVDEKLVWAIMKAESNFRPEVASPAGAIGLMQMMPTTARKVVGNNPHSGFDSRMLIDPEINIELSMRYLKDFLWKNFPGDHVSVIASYNAGEEAVTRWLKNKPLRNDIEMFVEEIPYSETCRT